MLEITGDDIALLNDGDLRSLVALLCEAQLRSRSLSTSAVTWGGNQDAGDAGIDVRVKLPAPTKIDGFIPRASVGFQVKKPDMARAAILKEMRPKGKVRPVIRELAAQSGAYIMVSSSGSTSDKALQNRCDAMRAAVKGIAKARGLLLDFYDRGRVATWVREHPGFIPWVRVRIGKALAGWQSHGPWAYAQEGLKAEYLIDDKTRIQSGKKEDGPGISTAEGLNRIRNIVRQPRRLVRIVGLSGVGKTRFVQALFDGRVGEASLDPSFALYVNLADNPDPQPVGMASDLIASRTRAILVVDNCPPELHRRLSEVCRLPESTVSVITVEYDIQDDEPEETEVFRIETSSPELIQKLVTRRFPALSLVDAQTIANFSGGNARIAIALAGMVRKNESLAGLKDEDLFKRLFQQRHEHDDSLLLAAQACALVYSFQGEALDGDDAELPKLGALVGKSAEELFRTVAQLKRRDLVQKRGAWRAVLPHAIANRLASMALESVPAATIDAQLVNGGSVRLLKSFSRRLGYLHESAEAQSMVQRWLAAGGLLGNVSTLNELGRAVFDNVAPVAPEATLAALERAPLDTLSDRSDVARLLRSLAYDPALFERSAEMLVRLIEAEQAGGSGGNLDSHLVSLFFLYLSGTHASVEQRIKVLDRLLRSAEPARQRLGLNTLGAMLEAWHFMSGFSFEFGARSRDHGYWPRTVPEMQHWFASVLRLAETLAVSCLAIAPEVCATIAGKLRGLWTKAGMFDDLEHFIQTMAKRSPWREGWIAVRQTLRFDGKGMPPKFKARLAALEELLRPTTLLDKVRAIVLSKTWTAFDLDDFDYDSDVDEAGAIDRRDKIAAALGKQAANDQAVLCKVLPELVVGEGRLGMFGRGLAGSARDPEALWQALVAQFTAAPEGTRNVQVLCGFLDGLHKRDAKRASALLDETVAHAVLGKWFPVLQCSVPIDGRGVERLREALDLGQAPVGEFRVLAYGRASDPITGPDLRALLVTIAAKPTGFMVAADILGMRIHSDKDKKREHEPEIIDTGRSLMRSIAFEKANDDHDYKLAMIARNCLKGPDGVELAQAVYAKLRQAISTYDAYAFQYDELVKSLLKVQPKAMLDAFFSGNERERGDTADFINEISEHHANLLDSVLQDDLFGWCEANPAERYPALASVVTLFSQADEKASAEWSSVALALLDRAPDRLAVLKQFVRRFRPRSWSGSYAAALEAPLPLLFKFEEHSDPTLAEFARREGARLRKDVERARKHETEEDRASDERFE